MRRTAPAISMPTATKKVYKSIRPITLPVIIIAICFILGIADMIFLRGAMNTLIGLPMSMASIMALILATVANFAALLWGRATGEHSEEHSINRYSLTGFIPWLIIGFCYMAIRVLNLLKTIETGTNTPELSDYTGEIIQMVILAILYVSTGTTISAEARIIFDQNENEYRHRAHIFKKQHQDLSADAADLQEKIGQLKGYDRNYKALQLQYEKIKQSIRKAEAASMADIVGKTLRAHPEITPSEAHAIMNEILSRRDS